jgi:hypothetical protein
MPRGVKGSGKVRKPAGEPGQPRRRGRKPKELLPEAEQPAGLPATEEPAGPLPAEESRPAGELPAEETIAEPAPAEEQVPGVQPPSAQPAELADDEAELVRKYPHVGIKPGSLRPGAAEGWGNKRVVTIVCSACQVNERVVATSDLFHVSRCEECSRAAKKAARKAKKQSKPN